MDTSLDKFYAKVYAHNKTIPEDILGLYFVGFQKRIHDTIHFLFQEKLLWLLLALYITYIHICELYIGMLNHQIFLLIGKEK